MLNPYNIVVAPYLTEKTMRNGAQYTFKVNVKARKPVIKKAIEQIFNIKVKRVCTTHVPGKKTSFRGKIGQCSDWKKAIVILEEGSEIDLDNFK